MLSFFVFVKVIYVPFYSPFEPRGCLKVYDLQNQQPLKRIQEKGSFYIIYKNVSSIIMDDLQTKIPKLDIKEQPNVLTVPLLFQSQPMRKIERRYLLLHSSLHTSTMITEPWGEGICLDVPFSVPQFLTLSSLKLWASVLIAIYRKKTSVMTATIAKELFAVCGSWEGWVSFLKG